MRKRILTIICMIAILTSFAAVTSFAIESNQSTGHNQVKTERHVDKQTNKSNNSSVNFEAADTDEGFDASDVKGAQVGTDSPSYRLKHALIRTGILVGVLIIFCFLSYVFYFRPLDRKSREIYTEGERFFKKEAIEDTLEAHLKDEENE